MKRITLMNMVNTYRNRLDWLKYKKAELEKAGSNNEYELKEYKEAYDVFYSTKTLYISILKDEKLPLVNIKEAIKMNKIRQKHR